MIPTGVIALWVGTEVSIPPGWTACDGTNGTPDLRSLFIRGAGSGIAVDETGGTLDHQHDFDAGSHDHDLEEGNDVNDGEDFSTRTDNAEVTGSTEDTPNIPPYYGLWYVMKIDE